MNYLKRPLVLQSTHLLKTIALQNKRPLFSASDLGIDSFLSNKKRTEESLQNPELVKVKLEKACTLGDKTLVFSHDILKMVYLAQTDKDLETLSGLLHILCLPKKVKLEKYSFGAEVMRLYHVMNKPDQALALMKNEVIFSELQSINTFTVLLDLLFKNKLYKEVLEMYDYRHRHIPETFSYRLSLLYFAACYKLNTKESFDLAGKMWQNLVASNRHSPPGLRIRLFLAALSLNQNHINCVIELLAFRKFHSLCESILCMAFCKIQRFNDGFERIIKILNSDLAEQFFMPLEALNIIEEEVITYGNEEIKEKFLKIKEELISKNHIVSESLDHFLCADVKTVHNKTN